MPYAIYLNSELVAYVGHGKAVIERKRAAIIEPCLEAYGLSVNMGVDESISYPRRLDGFPVKISDPDIDENLIVTAISVCLALDSAVKPEIEEVEEKIYEVTTEKKTGGRNHGGEEEEEEEIEFEAA